MKIILIITSLMSVYSLISKTLINNIFKINKFKYNHLQMYKFNEYDKNKDMYTIISKSKSCVIDLVDILEQHNINYIYIDISELSIQEINMILKYYNIINFDMDNILIFKNFDEYIGGVFEMYDIILKN